MEKIILSEVVKKGNRIDYKYEASEGLSHFFTERVFCIDYPENVEAVPDSVAAIPFVCNVLPIIWLTDSKLIVPELDEAFYNCIPEVKKGYEAMYPESEFLGEIEAARVVPCDRPAVPGKCAMFYSGGVDSADTLIRHLSESPDLVSIWGSDIAYDNADGWAKLRTALDEAAVRYDLNIAVIRSRFREFDNERELSKQFSKQLKRNYWYGIKHGLALLGHVAPYAYLRGLTAVYIASSNCPQDGEIRCASDPRTDNRVRFAHCRVIHDGFECTRQDKLRNITEYFKDKNDVLPLHVCWETQTGHNCCMCEKCYRTMAGLIFENADPTKYGFPDVRRRMRSMQESIVLGKKTPPPKTWNRLHEDAVARSRELKKSEYWKDLKWLTKADFLHPETLKMPAMWRIRSKLSKSAAYRLAGRVVRSLFKH